MYRARAAVAILLAAAFACIFWPSHQHKPVAALTAAYTAAPQLGKAIPARQAPAVTTAAQQRQYTIRPGDTLTSVAVRHCPRPADWTGLYAANRHHLGGNPDIVRAGVTINLDCYDAPGIAQLAVRDQPRDTWTAPAAITPQAPRAPPVTATAYVSSGTYSYAGLEQLWISADGPSWAAPQAAQIAECESGGRTDAYNPSGATGLWQILGAVVPGNLYNAFTNTLNAVSKFLASGSTFAQWVCK
jgi:hypothetical protein